MATKFYIQKGTTQTDIEATFRIRVTSVRGLNPSQPKAYFTREWATENGVDVYIPTYGGQPVERKTQSSEVVMTCYAEDEPGLSALKKYYDFCAFIFSGTFTYWDQLQDSKVELIYNANKPAWYFLADKRKVMFEITFLNPTGQVVDLGM